MTLSGIHSTASIEDAMRLYESQETLFTPKTSRLALKGLKLPSFQEMPKSVNIWRNHSFEPLESLMDPYFHFRRWSVDFRLSGYDDTLMFNEREDADADILWLDSDRLIAQTSFQDWFQWIKERLNFLRSLSKSPIILATWISGLKDEDKESITHLAASIPAVFFADLAEACDQSQIPLLDKRSAIFAGTPVSSSAQLLLAKILACHWLPAILLPPVKAIALDLDHTLHSGVLGEDGAQGVRLNDGHLHLQRYLKTLRQRGIFLALVSKNEKSDVEALFNQRLDYPLRLEDFSQIEVSWGDKASAIERIAKALRIAPDAVLFVDDNPGELSQVTMKLPQVHTLYAHPDAHLTQQAIHFYPGLWRWNIEEDDIKRISDLTANAEREALSEKIKDSTEYFRSLQVHLTYRHNPHHQLNRLADLCNKTNQFNLTLRRFNQAEIAQYLSNHETCATSVQLNDRFSDSGVIAVVIARKTFEQLVVEEVCISCRAMGRGLEDTVILLALRDMPIFVGCKEVVFKVQIGPRNQPAINWLSRLLNLSSLTDSQTYSIPAQKLSDFKASEGVVITNE